MREVTVFEKNLRRKLWSCIPCKRHGLRQDTQPRLRHTSSSPHHLHRPSRRRLRSSTAPWRPDHHVDDDDDDYAWLHIFYTQAHTTSHSKRRLVRLCPEFSSCEQRACAAMVRRLLKGLRRASHVLRNGSGIAERRHHGQVGHLDSPCCRMRGPQFCCPAATRGFARSISVAKHRYC